MLHAFEAEELVGKRFGFRAASFEYDDFQAVVVIEMHVRACQYLALIIVLRSDQLLRKLRLMVVVDQRESGDDHFVCYDIFCNKVITHNVANRFRPIFVTLLLDYPVKPFQKLPIKRNPCSY